MTLRSLRSALRPARPLSQARAARLRAAFRPRLEPLEDRCLLSGNVVLEWNQLALGAIKQTNANLLLASRALAITQTAVYDSVNAIDRSFAVYFAHVHASRGASLVAAAAEAAHDTLTALFPSQASTFDAALAADLVGIPPGRARQGTDVGHAVAQQILNWRSTDGSGAVVPYTPGTDPGDWQPTPPAFLPALGPQWPDVTPFAMTDGSQFRPAPPPALDSAEYAAAFNEVESLGRVDSTTRTADQTQIALFWKDPTAAAYAFGHWNEIAQQVSVERGLGLVADAHLFALLNLATADAIISVWDTKYTYNFWRPVTAIQFAGDSALNPATASDPTWTPLIATPNFPSYTSAHSTVSGAAAAVLTSVFGPDYHFTTGSDGLPGVTRSFASFAAAAAEAGQSRIYGGIHFQFDNQNGLASGDALGQFVVGNFLQANRHHGRPQLRISDVSQLEGSNGKTDFVFTVTLSAAYDQPVTLSYRTVNGSAKSGADFVAKTGTLTFAPGETTKTITIEVIGDSKQEANETFYLELFGNSGDARFTTKRGIGTILNDD
jgi:membrane-associated phospholipid phosphatase